MNHKSYLDIQVFQNKFADAFNKGDYIVIQEKLDGANASFQYDTETDSLLSFSRKNILDAQNTLREFKTMVDMMEKERFMKYPAYRFFGEWLVKHTVVYPKENYNKFYLFDVYDTDNQQWLSFDIVKSLSIELNLDMVHVFYEGEFINWEHISSFIGKTGLGGEAGEGIVIKNMTRLNNPDNRLPFYTKLVTKSFKEKTKTKVKEPIDPEKLAQIQYEKDLTDTIVTKARVQKILHKLVDENILPEDWGIEQMGIVAKNLAKLVYEDCVKEEKEIVEKVGADFGRYCQAASMNHAKEIASAF